MNTLELRKLITRDIGEAVGMASLCWQPKPTGVFDSDAAFAAVSHGMQRIDTLLDIVEACIAFVDAFQKQGPHVTYPTKEHVAMVDAVKFYRNNKDPKLDYIKHDEKFWEGKK